MKKPKTIKHTRVIGGYYDDSTFFKMTHQEFVDYCGARLAIALFKGEFNSELYGLITMANARGMKQEREDN